MPSHPSPTRTSQTHGRGATPSAASSTSAPSTPANANPAVSAALQGATLAFNKQKKAAAAVAGTSAGSSNAIGRGPSPSRPPPGQHTGTKPSPAAAAQGTGLRGSNGALLAATQAAREHAASRPRSAGESGNSGPVSRHATGGSRGGKDIGGSGPEGGHAHGSLVALRLSELHTGGGGGGGSTLLPPPAGRFGLDGANPASSTTSPSLIAATLAASRSASPVRGPIPQLDLNSGGRVSRARGQSVGSASLMANALNASRPATGGADAPDTASIPPTTSLVSLFERKKAEDDGDPVKKRAPSPRVRSPDAGGREKVKPKPKPKPKPKLSTDMGRPRPSDEAQEPSQRTSQAGHALVGGQVGDTGRSNANVPPQSRTESQNNGQQPAGKPKPPVDERPQVPLSPTSRDTSNHIPPQVKKPAKTPRPEPPTPPLRTTGIAKMKEATVQITPVEPEHDQIEEFHKYHEEALSLRRISQSSGSSNDTFVSASSLQSRRVSPAREVDRRPSRPAPPTRGSSFRSASTPDLHRPPAPHTPTPNLTLNSLTNAIMASNLASARHTPTTTPSQRPPVPAPRRPGRHHPHHGTHSPLQPHRTGESIRSQLTGGSSTKSPNPQQHQPQKTTLLQTLRPASKNPSPSDEEDEDARRHHRRRRNKVLGGGNRKHAHHEGSRRRWRDEITARERKRYEAVWASNRGLFLRGVGGYHNDGHGDKNGDGDSGRRAVSGEEADLVVNVVVRDIWARSRLPADELAEVWELVDRAGRGALGRDEFVVGLWLIDQRLRGRKIPARVGQSVWESVTAGGGGRGGGVVVPLPEGRGRKKGW